METIRVRVENERDAEAIEEILETAFGDQKVADLIRKLRASGRIEHGAVADIDGRVVGYVAFEELIIEPAPGFHTWALAPVAVLPEQQHQGIGSSLISMGINYANLAGVGLILVLGDPDYYGRFGFKAETAAALEVPWPGPHFMGLALDKTIEAKGRVVYPPAFFD